MNDSHDPILQQEEQRKLRVQLIWRLAIAVALVAGVLGILAWLEQDKERKPQMTVAAPREIRRVPASAPIASATTTASTLAASTPAIALGAQAPEIQPEASLPQTAPTTLPMAHSRPAPAPQTAAPVTPHASTMSISKPTVPVIAPPDLPTRPANPAQPVIPLKPAQPTAQSVLPQPQKLAAQQAAIPTPIARYPLPIATMNGYTVQAGVFLHSANAEKMLKQVQGAGIPAYLETRVQIGPFSNKAEAEAAVKKLRKMGVEPVLKTN